MEELDINDYGFEDTEDISDTKDSEISTKSVGRASRRSRARSKQVDFDNGIKLYIITDNKLPGMLKYFRERGVNVSNIMTKIEETKRKVMLESLPVLLVIVDTGTGMFTNTKNRDEIVDLISICDESKKIVCYYTDKIIQKECDNKLYEMDLDIEWLEYGGSLGVVAYLKNLEVDFILDGDSEVVEDLFIDAYKVIGDKVNVLSEANDNVGYDIRDIISNMNSVSGRKFGSLMPVEIKI